MSEKLSTRGGYCKISRPKGEFITVRPGEFNSKKNVTVRVMYHDEEGQEKFTPKGVTLNTRAECDKVCEQLQRFKETLPN